MIVLLLILCFGVIVPLVAAVKLVGTSLWWLGGVSAGVVGLICWAVQPHGHGSDGGGGVALVAGLLYVIAIGLWIFGGIVLAFSTASHFLPSRSRDDRTTTMTASRDGV